MYYVTAVGDDGKRRIYGIIPNMFLAYGYAGYLMDGGDKLVEVISVEDLVL